MKHRQTENLNVNLYPLLLLTASVLLDAIFQQKLPLIRYPDSLVKI